MEPNQTFFQTYKTDEKKTQIILNNILIMLSNRIYIDAKGNKHKLLDYDHAKENIVDRGEDTYEIDVNNGNKYAIKIMHQKISSIGKKSPMSEFFIQYPKHKKIIVANEFNKKISDFVVRQRAQIFQEFFFMLNIIDHVDQPQFEVLSPKEKEEYCKDYNATDYTTLKLKRNDPITRYYGLRKGDVVRVIRPSPLSGQSIAYRIVE